MRDQPTDAGRGLDLETRFHARIAAARSGSWVAGIGAAVLTLLVVGGLGLASYTCVSALFPKRLRIDAFLAVFAASFLAIGYYQYRRSIRQTGIDEDNWADSVLSTGTPTGPWWYGSGFAGGTLFLFAFRTLPSLVFHIVGGLLESRHYFQSPEAERLAFRLMADHRDIVPPEAVMAIARNDRTTARAALRLLVHLGFLRVYRKDGSTTLLHTLRWQEFCEN